MFLWRKYSAWVDAAICHSFAATATAPCQAACMLACRHIQNAKQEFMLMMFMKQFRSRVRISRSFSAVRRLE